jgi:uncharacterized protein (TIGR00369 family)
MREPFAATSPEQLVPLDRMLEMSGLDYMRAVLAGEFPMPPIAGLLDYRIHAVAPGRASFRGRPAFAHCNPFGTVHGGWYGAILDSALGCAVMTCVPQGRWYTTLEYKVSIVRPVPLGTEVECTAEVQHAGRSTAIATAEVRAVADGRLHATGTTTCIIMDGGRAEG